MDITFASGGTSASWNLSTESSQFVVTSSLVAFSITHGGSRDNVKLETTFVPIFSLILVRILTSSDYIDRLKILLVLRTYSLIYFAVFSSSVFAWGWSVILANAIGLDSLASIAALNASAKRFSMLWVRIYVDPDALPPSKFKMVSTDVSMSCFVMSKFDNRRKYL